MSFDDVARRMKERHGGDLAGLYGDSSSLPTSSSPQAQVPDVAQLAVDNYEAERRSRKSKDIVFGLILLVVGLALTLGTYDSASRSGGTYIIAYGPMIVGVIKLFRGLAG